MRIPERDLGSDHCTGRAVRGRWTLISLDPNLRKFAAVVYEPQQPYIFSFRRPYVSLGFGGFNFLCDIPLVPKPTLQTHTLQTLNRLGSFLCVAQP